ncbi:Organic cation transporter 1 [Pseudolycoriella hygida]|uniref:Organic cation transporter 1 n=1 Tax=Pseudolycoriella hygida TaxID=35572 RepID=A0A9Q0NGS2_9DIPT|nr:Organic cation transporter 1 [Pseudolycoriella hygida]
MKFKTDMTRTEAKVELRPESFNLDKVFLEIGEFGTFQVLNYICLCSAFIFVICSSFSYIFVTNDLEYRCRIQGCEDLNDSSNWTTIAIPKNARKCQMYERVSNLNDCSADTFNTSSIMQCNTFVFKTKEINILNEFGLTCEENRWKLTFIGSLGNIAECLTLPFIGLLADKYGRRPILIYSVLLVGVFGLAKSFAANYLTFAILHFLGSLFGAGTFAIAFVLGAEIVGPTKRPTGAAIITNGFSIAQILLALIAMNVSHFRKLLRILYILVLLVLSYFWLVPESVRWLYSVGRYEKAKKVAETAAKINRAKISNAAMNFLNEKRDEEKVISGNQVTNERSDKSPMLLILQSRKMMIRLINCCYCYLTNALIFYGLSVRSVDLAGDKYINLMLVAFMEIPGNLASQFVLKKVSRKWALAVSMILCGVFCVSSELLSNYDATWRLILFLLGKCSVSFSFTVLSVFVTEMFPTNCRMRLFNICKTCAGIGNIIAPQIPLLANLMPILPMFLFGATSISSALLVTFLPNIKHSQLPQTVADAINISRFIP